MPAPDFDLREWLECDPAAGKLWWKKKPGPKFPVGSEAGGDTNGRRMLQLRGKQFYVSHIVWWFVNDEWPPKGMFVDHIDGNPMNNSISNLRVVTPSQNQWNRKNDKRNASGFKGVTKQGQRWVAQIRVHRELHRLGLFDDPSDAAKAYAQAASALHAGFSRPGTLIEV